jgi:hypothetical protein
MNNNSEATTQEFKAGNERYKPVFWQDPSYRDPVCRNCGEYKGKHSKGDLFCPHDVLRAHSAESEWVCAGGSDGSPSCGHDEGWLGKETHTCQKPLPDKFPDVQLCLHRCTFPDNERVERHEFQPTPPRLSDGILDNLCSLCDQPRDAAVHAPAEPAGLEGCHELEGVMYDLFVHDPKCPKNAAAETPPAPQTDSQPRITAEMLLEQVRMVSGLTIESRHEYGLLELFRTAIVNARADGAQQVRQVCKGERER